MKYLIRLLTFCAKEYKVKIVEEYTCDIIIIHEKTKDLSASQPKTSQAHRKRAKIAVLSR